ncbi:integrator complex subunit 5 [Eurytemora carolleeae]|uniref:integrator complex subunit 5 n=1 Tax=Eurytemora carolleeae TaxID=1294199 RepID=UPI000C75E323|nr:integrator complex subunit 5 [Eurytemora carolleeae]|eukprot:XP_023331254.1 integrator complex subunit 5-like [Eurytemora affinis]
MTMGLVDPLAGNQRTKNNKEKDLMNQLKQFLEGVGKGRGLNLRLSGVALNLLKNLPCARDAVFEYYSVVFDRLVANYTPSSDAKSCTPEEEEMVGELQEVLSGFVETNPGSWAPIISQWSLDTLGIHSWSLDTLGIHLWSLDTLGIHSWSFDTLGIHPWSWDTIGIYSWSLDTHGIHS